MARYRLMSAHYIDGDMWLPGDKENTHLGDERGTVVGDGTPYKIKWPTLEMIALDDEAEEMLDKERNRLEINTASMTPIDDLPLDSYEKEYVPGTNTRRKKAKADGAPADVA